MSSDKSILLYGGIAIVVVIAVFIAIVVSFQPSGPYKLDVSMNAPNYNPNATYLFNTTYFNITISNTGSAPVRGMQVGFYLDDQAIKYYNVSIPAHESAYIKENYTYSQNGTYNFSVVADPSRILDIANSSTSSAQLAINVRNPQQPNLYQYIPSQNTNETYTFTLFPRGMELSSLMDIEYNVSQFKPLLGQDTGLSFSIMHDLSPLLNLGNGVYSKYSNGTTVYGLWLEGAISNADIKSLLSTYSFPEHSFQKGNSSAIFAKLNYTTSFCSYSSKGWTKIFIYYNATAGGNCEHMLGSKYDDTEYALLSNATSSHSSEYAKDANFTYRNSTSEGFAISLIGKNYSIYTLSEDGAAGNFASIMGFHHAINISTYHRVCPGYIYVNNSTGLSMCTEYFKSSALQLQNYSLSDSISISKNYTLQLYSFVDLNYSEDALFNAASLFTKLNITNQYSTWEPLDNNTCSFANSSIGCRYESFNSTSSKYRIKISNGFSSPINIEKIGCSSYLPVNATTSINETLAAGQSINASFSCKLPSIPISSTVSTYFMNMSYSMSGKQLRGTGTLTYSDFYVG